MGFKTKSGKEVGQPAKEFIPKLKKTPEQQQIELFKIVVKQMLSEGKPIEQIIAFAEDPNAVTRYGKEQSSDLDVSFFGGLKRYTTLDQRQKVLLELDNDTN